MYQSVCTADVPLVSRGFSVGSESAGQRVAPMRTVCAHESWGGPATHQAGREQLGRPTGEATTLRPRRHHNSGRRRPGCRAPLAARPIGASPPRRRAAAPAPARRGRRPTAPERRRSSRTGSGSPPTPRSSRRGAPTSPAGHAGSVVRRDALERAGSPTAPAGDRAPVGTTGCSRPPGDRPGLRPGAAPRVVRSVSVRPHLKWGR